MQERLIGPINFGESYVQEKDAARIMDYMRVNATTLSNHQDQRFILQINWKSYDLIECDVILFAYLCLIKQEHSNLFVKLDIEGRVTTIEGAHTKETTFALKDRIGSFCAHTNTLCGNDYLRVKIKSRFFSGRLRNSKKLKLHNHFIPPIPIGDFGGPYYERLFFQSTYTRIESIQSSLDSSEYQKYLAYILESFKKLKTNLGWGPKADWNASKWGNRKKQFSMSEWTKYCQMMSLVVREAADLPPIYTFVYLLILSNANIPKSKKAFLEDPQSSGLDYAESVINWHLNHWQFTRQIVMGIVELAKNIDQHASTHKGILTIRVYDSKYFRGAPDSTEVLHKLKSFERIASSGISEMIDGILDINIVDLGKQGILQSLYHNTCQELSKITDQPRQGAVTTSNERQRMEWLIGAYKADEQLLSNLHTNKFELRDLFATTKPKLHQQARRSIAHLGLLTLAALVKHNHGQIIVASGEGEYRSTSFDQMEELKNLTPHTGTFFKLLLPVIRRNVFHVPQLQKSGRLSQSEITGMADTLNIAKKHLVHVSPATNTRARELEAFIVEAVTDKLAETKNKIHPEKHPLLVNLDVGGCEFIDESSLFRVLATLSVKHHRHHLILSNITTKVFQRLVQMNTVYSHYDYEKGVTFWSGSKPVLVYSYSKNTYGRAYFTDILWGRTYKEFLSGNRAMNVQLNFSAMIENPFANDQKLALPTKNTRRSAGFDHLAFANRKVLLSFDTIIKHDGLTFFEYNAQTILQQELAFDGSKSRSIQGYKIENSHFRIGSKLHVDTFYYAKSFFQNSRHATRFATLLANDIFSLITKQGKHGIEPDISELTLIGYELHSEMLLTLAISYLESHFRTVFGGKKLKINSNIIARDSKHDNQKTQSGTLKIKNQDIYCNVIFVTPIASTLSTSVKQYEALKRIDDLPENLRVLKFYNLLLTIDKTHLGTRSPLPTEIEKAFNWQWIDFESRKITVRHTHDGGVSDQYYFIPLPTRWRMSGNHHKSTRCPDCFPSTATAELPLLETDNSSVTPSLIFTNPKVLDIEEKYGKSRFNLDLRHLKYGYTPNASHYAFSLETEHFLADNKARVSKWLHSIYKKQALSKGNDSVLLVAECNPSNMAFIKLVNEIVFLSAARIIHCDPKRGFVENIWDIYRDDFTGANKIFFVDNTIKTGECFRRVNTFVQSIINNYQTFSRPEQILEITQINGCISLFSQLQPHTYRWLENELSPRNGKQSQNNIKSIHAFAALNLFAATSQPSPRSSPGSAHRNQELSDRSYVSSVEERFKKKVKDADIYKKELEGRHLFAVWATHYLYPYFASATPNHFKFTTWKDFLDRFKETLHPDLQNKLVDHTEVKEFEEAVLKTLTMRPFILYRTIRETVFPWVLSLVENAINQFIRGELSIRDLKFYIRRTSAINSNFLISNDGLLHSGKLRDICDRIENEGDSLDRFDVFFVAQIKELIDKDPVRCIALEHVLTKMINESGFDGASHARIIRMTFHENGIYLDDIYEFFTRYLDAGCLKLLQNQIDPGNELKFEFERCNKFMAIQTAIVDNFRYKNLKVLLNNPVSGEADSLEPIDDKRFLAYIWIRSLLINDKNLSESEIRLSSKTEAIIDGIRKMLMPDKPDSIGSFFQVYGADLQASPTFIYDADEEGMSIFSNPYLADGNTNNLLSWMDKTTREKDGFRRTAFEFRRFETQDKLTWFDEHSQKIENHKPLTLIPAHYNRLILFGIRERMTNLSSEAQPRLQGLIGLYFKEFDYVERVNSLEVIRYLMIMGNELSSFIRSHHENQEFSEWQLSEQKKWFANLHGHGKNTFRRFITNLDKNEQEQYQGIGESANLLRMMIHVSEFNQSAQPIPSVRTHMMRTEPHSLENLAQRYEMLAKKIFNSNAIEHNLDLEEDDDRIVYDLSDIPSNKKDKPVPINLLDLIMFELLVNAKKNRAHFFPDEEDKLKNTKLVEISYSIEKNDILKIKISNFGLKFDQTVLHRLNKKQMVKRYADEISGTGMIWSVFDKLNLPSRNTLTFIGADSPMPSTAIYKNTAIVDIDLSAT